ncbi:MAG: nonstructural protein [Microviridae sp.]|nr:MAG: nonstructural protein [Microviridae sp.]
MNIYCIRDRMLDYFQDPFVAPNDYNVLASVSNVINNPEVQSAIAQAPHHFEIWRIATVDDQGHINESREFLADCSSLVRAQRQPAAPGARPTQEATTQRTGAPHGAQPGQHALQSADGNSLAPAGSALAQTHRTIEGGNN